MLEGVKGVIYFVVCELEVGLEDLLFEYLPPVDQFNDGSAFLKVHPHSFEQLGLLLCLLPLLRTGGIVVVGGFLPFLPLLLISVIVHWVVLMCGAHWRKRKSL